VIRLRSTGLAGSLTCSLGASSAFVNGFSRRLGVDSHNIFNRHFCRVGLILTTPGVKAFQQRIGAAALSGALPGLWLLSALIRLELIPNRISRLNYFRKNVSGFRIQQMIST